MTVYLRLRQRSSVIYVYKYNVPRLMPQGKIKTTLFVCTVITSLYIFVPCYMTNRYNNMLLKACTKYPLEMHVMYSFSILYIPYWVRYVLLPASYSITIKKLIEVMRLNTHVPEWLFIHFRSSNQGKPAQDCWNIFFISSVFWIIIVLVCKLLNAWMLMCKVNEVA